MIAPRLTIEYDSLPWSVNDYLGQTLLVLGESLVVGGETETSGLLGVHDGLLLARDLGSVEIASHSFVIGLAAGHIGGLGKRGGVRLELVLESSRGVDRSSVAGLGASAILAQ